MSALGRVKTAPYLCGRAIDFTAWGCRILLSGCCWTEVGGLHIPASIRWAYFAVQTRSNRVRPGVAGASDRRVTQTMHQATSTANLLTVVSFCVRTSFFYVRTSFFTYVRTYVLTYAHVRHFFLLLVSADVSSYLVPRSYCSREGCKYVRLVPGMKEWTCRPPICCVLQVDNRLCDTY